MSNQKPIRISLPLPCSQNWDEMKSQGTGKHCAHCNKQVVDFTGFSDKELFNYLRAHPAACGRFHEDQLQRPIPAPAAPVDSWKKWYGFAAGLLSLVSLKAIAYTPGKMGFATYLQPAHEKTGMITPVTDSTIIPLRNDATIRGRVTDKTGEPLTGAEVSWNGELVTQTGTDGKFELAFGTSLSLKPGIISVQYPELVPVVRNYHPSMGNIDYELRLCKPANCRIFMGIPLLDSAYFETPAIQFLQKSLELTDDHRSTLATLAEKLRNNPGVNIELTTGAASPPEIRRANYMLSLVRNYLVDDEGISEDRIHINEKLDHPELVKIVTIKIATEKDQ